LVAPIVDVGETETPTNLAGRTPSDAVNVCRPEVALISAVVGVVTGFVVIGNVADVLPDGMTTEAGTVTDVAVNDTVIPPDGAVPFRLTVPVADVPPNKDVGLTTRFERMAGETVSVWL